MKNKTISFVLAFVLTLTLIQAVTPTAVSAPETSITDVTGIGISIAAAVKRDPLDSASSWARDSISSAIKKGFVPVDMQQDYSSVITRQEFCRLTIKWLEYAAGKKIGAILSERGLSRTPNAFTDTSDNDILAAYALGITDGTGNNKFTPNGEFSREQAAAMIMNTCRVLGADVKNPPNSGFADLNTAADWARDGINFVRANGIMQGTGDNFFSPKETFTKEQSIVTFDNITQAAEWIAEAATPELPGANGTHPILNHKTVPILMYHTSSESNPGSLSELYVRPSAFRAQMEYLIEKNYSFCTFDDFENISQYQKPIFITFDDGYLANYTEIYPILKDLDVRITIFLVVSLVKQGALNWDHVVEMSDSGLVKFESHTMTHPSLPSISGNAKRLNTELEDSKRIIEEHTGVEVVALAYPNGEFNSAVITEARKHYKYALRKDLGKHYLSGSNYEIRRIRINRSTSLQEFKSLLGS